MSLPYKRDDYYFSWLIIQWHLAPRKFPHITFIDTAVICIIFVGYCKKQIEQIPNS